MARLLTEFLAAGLIENLDGDDERLVKMEKAAASVSRRLVARPPGLIQAILAGLDPDVSTDDPAVAEAEEALVSEWKSMRSVYTSAPVGLYRAILLDACAQAGEGTNAAILWLTAADTVPRMRLGKEEPVVRDMLTRLAERTEQAALVLPATSGGTREEQPLVDVSTVPTLAAQQSRRVDRDALLLRLAAAVWPQPRKGKPALNNPNPHVLTNTPQEWAWEFSDRMRDILADEMDALANEIAQRQTELATHLQTSYVDVIKKLSTALMFQQQSLHELLNASEARNSAQKLRLNALWWSEALYSPSLRRSYRELPVPLACVVMAFDLLAEVTKPTPSSVGYLLAESVHRLPEAGFDHERALRELLDALREVRRHLPTGWAERFSRPPLRGRLSLRDLVLVALDNQTTDFDEAMARAGLPADTALSLPELSRAIFRQEQAVQLAGGSR